MRLDTSMSQRLEQKMILAPRMIQSMEILQLPIMALQERIEHELEENPVLELTEETEGTGTATDDDEESAELEPPAEEEDIVVSPEKELVIEEDGDNEQDFDRLLAINEDWADHFNEEHRPSSNRVSEENDKKHDAMVNMASRPQSLQDYLNDQLAFLDVPDDEMRLIRHVVSHIDDNGYVGYTDEKKHYHPFTLEEIAVSFEQAERRGKKGAGTVDRDGDRFEGIGDRNEEIGNAAQGVETRDDEAGNSEAVTNNHERIGNNGQGSLTAALASSPSVIVPAPVPRPSPGLVARVEEALDRVQKLDPLGVGARDLKECLLLQLTPEIPLRDVLRVLIQNHLEDIQHNRLPVIQKKTGFSLETIQEAIEQLKHLNPKPGSRFTAENIPYVVPDIVVDRSEAGDYEVRLLDDWTPSIFISKRYLDMYRDRASDPKAREFLKRKIQSAQWLIEAIEQRRSTLTKVTRAIIQHQRAFLDRGPEFIEPFKMQQIADLVGVHVTTVSRAVDDKWVQTPRGIFSLKRFFGGGTHTSSGEEVAWETIKQKLLEIIAHEDKSNPLSDEDLVDRLSQSGYPVARRTVTKYRKMLNIASSRQRKVWTHA